MKKAKKNGKSISYGFANPELNAALRSLGHNVVKDRKKQSSKFACRKKGEKE